MTEPNWDLVEKHQAEQRDIGNWDDEGLFSAAVSCLQMARSAEDDGMTDVKVSLYYQEAQVWATLFVGRSVAGQIWEAGK